MTVVNDPDMLVGDYLARLEAAAGVLPAERRAELVDEVRAHIADARAEGAADEAETHSRPRRPPDFTDPAVREVCTGFAFPEWLRIPLLIVMVVAPALSVALPAERGAPGRG
ncbi:MAG TPA: hypothetical protein VGJ44_04995 [Kribbellaceae bacterium]|jgi:hypothetical protein